jgi:hypothetical protein
MPTTRFPVASSWPQYVGLKGGQLYIVFANGSALFPPVRRSAIARTPSRGLSRAINELAKPDKNKASGEYG